MQVTTYIYMCIFINYLFITSVYICLLSVYHLLVYLEKESDKTNGIK